MKVDTLKAFDTLASLIDISVNREYSEATRTASHTIAYWYKEMIQRVKEDECKEYPSSHTLVVIERLNKEWLKEESNIRINLYLPF